MASYKLWQRDIFFVGLGSKLGGKTRKKMGGAESEKRKREESEKEKGCELLEEVILRESYREKLGEKKQNHLRSRSSGMVTTSTFTLDFLAFFHCHC